MLYRYHVCFGTDHPQSEHEKEIERSFPKIKRIINMSSKDHRSGGKYCGSHTTVIPTAGLLVDLAVNQPEVSKIYLGFIKAGLHPVNGQRRVKFTADQGSLLLAVRDNTTNQEIRIYTSDVGKTRLSLARSARNQDVHVSFHKSEILT